MHRHLRQLCRAQCSPPKHVGGAIARDRREPCSGHVRDTFAGPSLQCCSKGVLGTLLGEVPVTGHSDQGRDDLAPALLERRGNELFDFASHSSQTGLISMTPCAANGSLAATSIASSRCAHSMSANPPICSLLSMNGPSLIKVSPLRDCTLVASVLGRRRTPSRKLIPCRSM